MHAVLVGPPDHVIAERQRLGLDKKDEVWDGEYHVAPFPFTEHQRVVAWLAHALFDVGESRGLLVCNDLNLFPGSGVTWRNYRVPDLVVCAPEVVAAEGVVGGAAMVIEVRSPGDESLAKLAYFDGVGVGEVVIVERDSKAIRRWSRLGGGPLVEQLPDGRGRHRLRCLPVALRHHDGHLGVEADGSTVWMRNFDELMSLGPAPETPT